MVIINLVFCYDFVLKFVCYCEFCMWRIEVKMFELLKKIVVKLKKLVKFVEYLKYIEMIKVVFVFLKECSGLFC